MAGNLSVRQSSNGKWLGTALVGTNSSIHMQIFQLFFYFRKWLKKMSKFSLTMGETGLDTPVNCHFIGWVCSYHAPVLPADKAA